MDGKYQAGTYQYFSIDQPIMHSLCALIPLLEMNMNKGWNSQWYNIQKKKILSCC